MVLGRPHSHLLTGHQLCDQLPPLKLFSAHGEDMKTEVKHPSFQVSFWPQAEVTEDQIEHISTQWVQLLVLMLANTKSQVQAPWEPIPWLQTYNPAQPCCERVSWVRQGQGDCMLFQTWLPNIFWRWSLYSVFLTLHNCDLPFWWGVFGWETSAWSCWPFHLGWAKVCGLC